MTKSDIQLCAIHPCTHSSFDKVQLAVHCCGFIQASFKMSFIKFQLPARLLSYSFTIVYLHAQHFFDNVQVLAIVARKQ